MVSEDGPPQNSVIFEPIDPEQPAGVRQMEAITSVWTKKWLIAAYSLITLISFINSLQQQANFAWNPFVTSSFKLHGLTGITGLVANLVSGVSKLPLAKFIDVVGRPHGFALCLLCVMLSLVMMATCHNVQTYCAAQVFYWTGMNGIDYVLNIFIADTSLLKNRLIWLAITNSPYICNTFAGPKLGETFLNKSSWRWGYASFVIITPFMCIPFWGIFWLLNRRAQKLRVIERKKSDRTVVQSIAHWCVEFDAIGLLLVCSGCSIFLLPISLAAYQEKHWHSPLIPCMIVVGFLFLVLFVAWERFWAPKAFFPFKLLKNSNVVAACLLGFNTWMAFYSYKMYYGSYLQVVFGLSVARAGYITNIFNLVSCTWAVFISFVFKYTDTYKWGAIIAMPIQVLMSGLLIHFRKPNTHIVLLVIVEVLNAMATAMLVQIELVAVMSAVPHQNMAVSIALLGMITSIGGAIGQTISTALWTNIVPRNIAEYLPDDKKQQAIGIYSDLVVQLGFPLGSPERQAIIRAFGDAQRLMVIVGTIALVPCFLWVYMLKNNRMSQHKERKGLMA
ncbi:siderophore iron transporter mirB [Ophiobolus disseminans]|uniref:Siderophore iron transporter mirB n=1 Tax=Ophiobolus disseminans TaxID=1469910 RepID=A0A6A7AKJ5_9PLEO|nr:siderophore iron transporter mirB [Ophiobolus disseminans]